MSTCTHDWRVDPFFTTSTIPPAMRLVCCKCQRSQIQTDLRTQPFTDDPATWPKPSH